MIKGRVLMNDISVLIRDQRDQSSSSHHVRTQQGTIFEETGPQFRPNLQVPDLRLLSLLNYEK
jgi:hypothetical protein